MGQMDWQRSDCAVIGCIKVINITELIPFPSPFRDKYLGGKGN